MLCYDYAKVYYDDVICGMPSCYAMLYAMQSELETGNGKREAAIRLVVEARVAVGRVCEVR